MGIAHSEYAEDRANAGREHSSEAFATTSNVEIEAPTPTGDQPREVFGIRDALIDMINYSLRMQLADDWNPSAIDDGAEAVIGIEINGSLYFVNITEA